MYVGLSFIARRIRSFVIIVAILTLVYSGSFYLLVQKVDVAMVIAQCVEELEVYKSRHGTYPESLKELSVEMNEENLQMTNCLADPWAEAEGEQWFRYARDSDGRNYRLSSVGLDAKPNTADDIVPTTSHDVGPSN